MVRLNTFVSALPFLAPVASAASAVLDLIPSNFDSVVLDSGKPALVEFFAPWCGHCKTLAPTYEELASKFAFASDKVVIGKVDADEHKALGKKYGVQGFPTLKWFDGKSKKPEDYDGGRDLESLSAWITKKTGLKPKTVPSSVVILDDISFKDKVGGDQNVIVAFTAPWCGRKYPYFGIDDLKKDTKGNWQIARSLLRSGRRSLRLFRETATSSLLKSTATHQRPRR